MPQSEPKLFRRVIKTVLVLLGISAGILFCAVHSEKFAQSLARFLVERAGADGKLKITIDAFAGSIADGLTAKSLRLIQSHPALDISINDLQASINFERLFPAGILSLSGRTGHIDVSGVNQPWPWLFDLPAYSGPACLANLPTNIEIHDFSVASIRLVPWAELPAAVNISSFTLMPASATGELGLELVATTEWRSRNIGAGSLSGTLKQRQNRFEGTANICFAGQKVTSEICLQQKRKKTELSGHIASASLDLASLSHWLGSLWQNEIPLGFDGRLDCSGSWLFNSDLGFLGNLSGKCEHLRMVALGFFFPLVELNGNWQLFDGNFIFNDSGSFFAGFPASLTGQIESIVKSDRNWHFNFSCPVIDFAQLADELPWGLKYSLNVPEISGLAALSLLLNGKLPEISCRVTTEDLKIDKNSSKRAVSGQANFHQHGLGSSSLQLDFTAISNRAVPPFFSRFHGKNSTLFARIPAGAGPYSFNWKMTGTPMLLNFSGRLTADAVELFCPEGHWQGGVGRLGVSLTNNSQSSETFSAEGINFMDLLLAR